MQHARDGRVVEVAARTRTISPALRRALQHRDRGCRFPGCGLPFGQGHHVQHWADGGPTTLSNLALLCRRHHRAVHEEGLSARSRPGWRASIPPAERPAAARDAACAAGARRSRACPARTKRGGGA
ncbi:MAG TPA: HNH endonuclease signature motif containing protein [Methylomirabilota bacterium]|nr:HNH endonuclease signature motif containing protein [Methylomirabilota bacterium]